MAKIDLGNVLTTAIASAATQMAADPGNKVSSKDVPAIVEAAKEVAEPLIKEAQAQYNYATNNESLATSYSFIGGLTSFLGALGVVSERLWDGYSPADDNTALMPALAIIIGSCVTLYGRLFRNKPLGQ